VLNGGYPGKFVKSASYDEKVRRGDSRLEQPFHDRKASMFR
jgi:hypothetical protein